MSDNSRISWTSATWNLVIGCDKVSPGCDSCYAIRTAHRMQANPNPKVSGPYSGTEAGMEWTGRVNLVEDRLGLPLKWRKPRRIFVNAQSDLFHKSVPDEFIARAFAVMALTPHHTYQILTKRHGRMRSLLDSELFYRSIRSVLHAHGWGEVEAFGTALFPLRNVHLGVSVENQEWADIRIPALLDTPAAVRWVSAEPLLGPIDLRLTHYIDPDEINPATGRRNCGGCSGWPGIPHQPTCYREPGTHWGIDWVVAGGESGPGARPMDPEWTRDFRRQCAADGVPFFFKQYGAVAARELGLTGAGSDPSEWPEVWPQEYPDA